MSNSNMSSDISVFPAEKMEVRPFGNLHHRVYLRISNVCNFFISERKHKERVVFFLV